MPKDSTSSRPSNVSSVNSTQGADYVAPEQKLLFCSALNKAILSLNKTKARNASYCFGSEQADLCIGMKEGCFVFCFLNLIFF